LTAHRARTAFLIMCIYWLFWLFRILGKFWQFWKGFLWEWRQRIVRIFRVTIVVPRSIHNILKILEWYFLGMTAIWRLVFFGN